MVRRPSADASKKSVLARRRLIKIDGARLGKLRAEDGGDQFPRCASHASKVANKRSGSTGLAM